jgi:hypothetical protein
MRRTGSRGTGVAPRPADAKRLGPQVSLLMAPAYDGQDKRGFAAA